MTTPRPQVDFLGLLRGAERALAADACLGGWRAQAGAVLLVMVAGDGRVGLGPTWHLTPSGHVWASPRWGSYPKRVQGNAARSLALFDVLTGGAVLTGAARAGVAQGVLDAARGLRAQWGDAAMLGICADSAWALGGVRPSVSERPLNNNSNNNGGPGRKDTSPWVCASEARSGEVNTQTVQG